RFNAERKANRFRSIAQGFTLGEQCRAMDVRGEIAVAEIEPVAAAKHSEALKGVKGFSAVSPALGGFNNARERVGNNVEVGRDFQAVERYVVAGVDDYRERARVRDIVEAE